MSRTPRSPRADAIHRFALSLATIPVEQERPEYGEISYHPRGPDFTDSQRRLARGDIICQCEAYRHCGKVATLHEGPCSFCYGYLRPKSLPPLQRRTASILRYYVCDDGWWHLRHQVNRMRQVVGMERLDDLLPPFYPRGTSTVCSHTDNQSSSIPEPQSTSTHQNSSLTTIKIPPYY